MFLADALTIYRFELRAALRERSIVVNTILIPILLYPLLLWSVFTGISFVQGQAEGDRSRVALAPLPPGHEDLLARLESDNRIELLEQVLDGAEERIRAGSLDAAIELRPGSDAEAFTVTVAFSAARERSEVARERVTALVERHRQHLLERRAAELGVPAETWTGFGIATSNVASEEEMGSFVLGLVLPLFFVVMVAVGCSYPAVDTLAGERERGTWETLLSSAASRPAIVAGKYLYVVTLGGLAGVLNLGAMTVTMGAIISPLLSEGEKISFAVPISALPVLVLAAVLLAAFVSAGMMLLASFAHTFKEGQSMIVPLYLLVLAPLMFLQVPGIEFTLSLAAVPVVNVTLMTREALAGVFHLPQIVLTVAVSLAAIAGAVRLAAVILSFEDVVLGSFSGSMTAFLRQRVFARRPEA